LTAVDWSLSGDYTTVETWTVTEDPNLTTTTVVGYLVRHATCLLRSTVSLSASQQCTTTPKDFVITEPTVVATSTNKHETVTVTQYPATVTATTTETISFYGRR
jgi:hypothetical protein